MEILFTNEELETTKALAQVGYTLSEIAIAIEKDVSILENVFLDKHHPFSRAYYEGKNILVYTTRKSLADLARNGSTPAALKIFELIEKQNNDEATF